jgi:hypothetical protein
MSRPTGPRRPGAGRRADSAAGGRADQDLLQLCSELAASGAGEVAEHIRSAIDGRSLDAGSLLSASLSRDQGAIRTGAVHRGLAPDLVWLVAELAVGPFAHALQRAVFANAARTSDSGSQPDDPLMDALHRWQHGYCPACGSWPAMAEVVDGHRTLRCSFLCHRVGTVDLRVRTAPKTANRSSPPRRTRSGRIAASKSAAAAADT